MAESDGRQQFEFESRADYFGSISMLHDVAVGMYQLHREQIAHQDLRAANVLCYRTARAKIADLGKAVDPEATADHVKEAVPGDETYAAPELLYNHVSPEWAVRRFGNDLYLLGSLIVTFFMGTGMTPQIFAELPSDFHPSNWHGESYLEVLPYLKDAAAKTFQKLQIALVRESGDGRWANEITDIVRQLCDPDPSSRGDPEQLKRGSSRFNTERYVAKLDRLAKAASTFRKKAA